MKYLLLILLLFISHFGLAQNQSEYTGFLEQAVRAAKDNDAKNFEANLKYLSAALERDHVSPEMLSAQNRGAHG